MLYESCYRIEDQVLTTLREEERKELDEHYSKCALNDIIKRMVRDGTIDQEKWYTFRYGKRRERCYTPWGEEEVTTFAVEINPAKADVVIIKTAEEKYLLPAKTFRQKLKHCMKYLKARYA